ncbi:MAG: hypothetical protein AB7I33_03195 [Gemmatimonadales bacterium]
MKLTRMALTLAAAALIAATPAAAQAAPSGTDSLSLARKYTNWFFTGQMDSVLAHMNEKGRASTTAEELMQRLDMLTSRAGNEVAVLEEKFVKRNGQTQYWRTSQFDNFDEPLLFRWVILPKGEIGGMGMGPASQAPPIDPE